jgi:hypothetical protein
MGNYIERSRSRIRLTRRGVKLTSWAFSTLIVNRLQFSIAMVFALASSQALAQEEPPPPDVAAVDSTEYIPQVKISSDPGNVVVTQTLSEDTYRSESLRGNFLAQWMFINQGGKRVNFWGARIIKLDSDSPLKTLGVRPGDVITRLDGLPIWRGMYKEQGMPWQVVELENHFGQTEVRYIARGTHQVRVGQINIDSTAGDISPLPP